MPLKMPREAQQYHDRAINSMRLAIEHFNRPSDEGRAEAVLHFALHAHEMLAKAILRNRKKRIQRRGDPKTISFEQCLNLLDWSGEKVVDDDQRLALVGLSNVRGSAQHSIIEISEQELFLHAQAALTALDELLEAEFGERLADFLPTRVLPISTDPPKSMTLLVDSEVGQIKELLRPGRRHSAEAKAKLRSLLSLDLAAAGESRGPTPREVDRAAQRLKQGRAWYDVLPNLAGIELHATGEGQTYAVRISKSPGAPPVRFAESDDDIEDAAIIREVDRSEQYPFNITELARLCGITMPKAVAVAWVLGLREAPEFTHEFAHGKSRFLQYSYAALAEMRETLKQRDLDDIWAEYQARDR